jgi:hypothetical protein
MEMSAEVEEWNYKLEIANKKKQLLSVQRAREREREREKDRN